VRGGESESSVKYQVWPKLAVLTAAALTSACGGRANSDAQDLSAEIDAPETVLSQKGAEFLRVDQWDPMELEQILMAAESEPGEAVGPEKLAAQLRGVMAAHNAVYIEREAPLELARRIIEAENAPAVNPGTAPQVGRYIYGYDNRGYSSGAADRMAFSERGCSATAIGSDSGATAAHCVFDSGSTGALQGFFCDQSARGTTGTPVTDPGQPSYRLAAANLGATCSASNRSYARWRFGVDGMNGDTDWMGPSGCMRIIIPTKFVTEITQANYLQSSTVDFHYELARWDYAALDFLGCANQNPAAVYGTQIMTDAQINAATAMSMGYPRFANCEQVNSAPDCPTQGDMMYFDQNGNPASVNSSGPYGGAYAFLSGQDPDITPGAFEPAHTILAPITTGQEATYALDTSPGNSGGPLISGVNLIGIASLSARRDNTTQVNVWHRWNSETDQFMVYHTRYPED
jgi:hypothetical protein